MDHTTGALRERAAALRSTADELGRRIDAIGWRGLAADAMRERAHAAVRHLHRSADLHDDAADAAQRHAAAAAAQPVSLGLRAVTHALDHLVA